MFKQNQSTTKQQLFDEILPWLELPTDRSRLTTHTFQGATQSMILSPTLSHSLRELSQKESVPLFIILLATLQTLLYRYTGQEDIVVGSPMVSRSQSEAEKLIEGSVDTRIFYTNLHGNPTFRVLLDRVRQAVSEAPLYSNYSAEQEIEERQTKQRGHRMLFCPVIFTFQEGSTVSELSDISLNLREGRRRIPQFEVAFSLVDTEQKLIGVVDYNADLFDATTITRMMNHFQRLLESIVANPEQPISMLSLLVEDERHQILVEWNNPSTDYPKEQCIHQLVEAQVAKTPEALAVVFTNEYLSYHELNSRSNRLAHYLQRLGVGPEVRVGICVERSPEMLIGLLGILKAGGAYVPLDPVYPKDRLGYMLADAQVTVLLTQQKFVSQLPKHKATLVCLDTDWKSIRQEPETNPGCKVFPENLAYVIYTSGSTGQPKGVAITHHSAVALLEWARMHFAPEALSSVLASTSLCFDLSVFELFVPLSGGGKIILSENVLQLPTLPAAKEVTLINTVPSAMAELLRINGVPPSVHTINLAGEALLTPLVQQIYHLQTIKQVFDLYGPSEDTTYSTCALRKSDGPATIGRPIINTQIYLLDHNLQPVPVGISGEIYIGGAGLARGYLHCPELTAEKFLPHPFSTEPGARLYKTGDLARYLPDGNIEFLGRIDHQVKIRGFRIELEEIEAILRQHPAVQEAVVLAREDIPGDKRLVAYVIPVQAQKPTARALLYFLQKKLPPYMIPSTILFLDALPLMPNGKLNRRALPPPALERPELENPYVAPRNPTEEVLTTIWSQLLGLDYVGIYDNFFDLGGHSLFVTQFVARVRDTFQVELPLQRVFDTPTVADLAVLIESKDHGESHNLLPLILPLLRNEERPLSFSQERVWFIQQLNPTNRAYHFQATLQFTGQLYVEALEQSLNEIVRRHEIYRTTFLTKEGKPVQIAHPAQPVDLPVIDLRTMPEDERKTMVPKLIDKELQKPFNLAQLPLIRWTLFRVSEQQYVLLHVEHHIIHDGWSFNVFVHELLELYKAFVHGRPSPLPELPIQFGDFAHWQRQWMQGEVLESQLAYWKKQLAGSPSRLELPLDHPRPAVQRFHGSIQRLDLPRSLCTALRMLSRQEGVTLFMTMLTTFVVLLSRYSGQTDISVGSGIANRRWRESEGLIGMIINNVVLRTDLSGNPTIRELLRRVRKVTLEAYAHQDVPFSKVVEVLQPERSLSHNPLFQVMFSFHDAPMPEVELSELAINIQLPLSNGSAKCDLNIIVIPHSKQWIGLRPEVDQEGLTMVWEYDTDLFAESTIARLVRHYQTLLESIVADCTQPLSALSLLTESEKSQILIEWNDTTTDYPKDQCIHQLFEIQTEQTPDHVAVVFEDKQFTYRELNARANQLAHYLKKRGVGPEVLVGVCVERSVEMVIGLLGILKAGGAYVPLDSTFPKERLAFMIEEAQLPIILTQERLLKALPATQTEVVCLDTVWEAFIQESTENLISDVEVDNLAYVSYTSGSAGRPKGVCIPHRGVLRLVKGTDFVHLGPEEVLLQFAPLAFDASTFEIWGALLNGARLVLFPASLPSMEELGRALEQSQVTTLWLTAGLFHHMVDTQLERLRTIRQLLAGGDVLSVPHVQKALQELKDCILINGYGPTENTTFSCTYPMTESSQISTSVPIGRPIANTEIYILDAHLQPVPVGVPGELYLGGAGLARGYLNQPALTAEAFIPHPFSDQPGARLYKTGDLARYLPDGNIEFLGRRDYQVKIRGFRIELGEIETVLGQYPAVREVIVLAQEGISGEKRLIAYIVFNGEHPPAVKDLRGFLQQHLPAYMIPAVFVFLQALPLTPNGKVDRRALPVPDQRRPGLEEAFAAPRNFIEEVLAGIWAHVLHLDSVGIYDNFFALGGHSLLATQIMSRVHHTFQVDLPLRALFETPTVAGLAQRITQNLRKKAESKDLNSLLQDLESLSDQEVESVLEPLRGKGL